jgi:hypothetical protein
MLSSGLIQFFLVELGSTDSWGKHAHTDLQERMEVFESKCSVLTVRTTLCLRQWDRGSGQYTARPARIDPLMPMLKESTFAAPKREQLSTLMHAWHGVVWQHHGPIARLCSVTGRRREALKP